MRYANIKPTDISNGDGTRVSFFVSGCEFHCKGCFNKEAWDFDYGEEFTEETINTIIKLLDREYIRGLSILGGEPLHPKNINEVKKLIECCKKHYTDKTIWIYTGYTLEDLTEQQKEVVNMVNVLVDGQFEEYNKVIDLKFRGSTNQRIIDIDEMKKDGVWRIK